MYIPSVWCYYALSGVILFCYRLRQAKEDPTSCFNNKQVGSSKVRNGQRPSYLRASQEIRQPEHRHPASAVLLNPEAAEPDNRHVCSDKGTTHIPFQ